MCSNCGINHDTNELEDQEAFDAFLDRLLLGSGPVESFIEERGLTPEFEMSGELNGKTWTVKVAEIPLENVEDEYRDRGDQWWALDGYYDNELVVSSEGAPPEPVTAEEAAQVYAAYHFDFEVSA